MRGFAVAGRPRGCPALAQAAPRGQGQEAGGEENRSGQREARLGTTRCARDSAIPPTGRRSDGERRPDHEVLIVVKEHKIAVRPQVRERTTVGAAHITTGEEHPVALRYDSHVAVVDDYVDEFPALGGQGRLSRLLRGLQERELSQPVDWINLPQVGVPSMGGHLQRQHYPSRIVERKL